MIAHFVFGVPIHDRATGRALPLDQILEFVVVFACGFGFFAARGGWLLYGRRADERLAVGQRSLALARRLGPAVMALAAFMFGLGTALPRLVSHASEWRMINGPGALDHGACCVEPTYHWISHALVTLGSITFLLGWLIWAASAVTRICPSE